MTKVQTRIRLRGSRAAMAAVPLAVLALLAGCGSTNAASTSNASAADAQTMSLQDLYAKAKAEGKVTVYGGGSIVPEITPAFEKAFPGIKVDNVDATDDALVARAISESRGGKTLGDVWQTPLDSLVQMNDSELLLPLDVPEGKAYPANLKGSYWLASDEQFLTIAWNTNLVAKGTEPKSFEDLADPRWKGKLVAEPRDYQMLEALAKYKFKDDQAAKDLMTRIAANSVQFHKGHNDLDQLVAGGQAAVCWTCYSNHFPPLIKKGAPVAFSTSEGVGQPNGTAVFKNAPHPYSALLFLRWVASTEGQTAYAAGGRIPALASVQPTEATRVQTAYALSPEDFAQAKQYSDSWNAIFGLR
jgi:iron(III) transport system substrate-binding protein